jgi:Glu/Leu/Phe/Val dehydrogenase, dimerisation domain
MCRPRRVLQMRVGRWRPSRGAALCQLGLPGWPRGIPQSLLAPRRVVRVDLVTEGDDGRLMHRQGFRVQHNFAHGPFNGGLRYHPTVDYMVSNVTNDAITERMIVFPGGRGRSTVRT